MSIAHTQSHGNASGPSCVLQPPGPHAPLVYPAAQAGGRPIITSSISASIASSAHSHFSGWITGAVVPRPVERSDGRLVTELWFCISYRLCEDSSREPRVGSVWAVSLEPVSTCFTASDQGGRNSNSFGVAALGEGTDTHHLFRSAVTHSRPVDRISLSWKLVSLVKPSRILRLFCP